MFRASGRVSSSEATLHPSSRCLTFANRIFESGRVKPNVFEHVWPLEELANGLEALEKRRTWGKVIVRVRNDDERARL